MTEKAEVRENKDMYSLDGFIQHRCFQSEGKNVWKHTPGFPLAGRSQRALSALSWPGRCCRGRWQHHPPKMDRWRWQFGTPQGTPPLAGSALWFPNQIQYLKFSQVTKYNKTVFSVVKTSKLFDVQYTGNLIIFSSVQAYGTGLQTEKLLLWKQCCGMSQNITFKLFLLPMWVFPFFNESVTTFFFHVYISAAF